MEKTEIRIKRLKIRSWRRGTKEMDLFFGRFADRFLMDMDSIDMDAFEALLHEEDPIITAWVTGHVETPERHKSLVNRMRVYAESLNF